MTRENFAEDHVSHSKFCMIRCLVSVAHADGVFCDEEREYVTGMMNRIPLSSEQRATLEADFRTPQDVADLMRQINDPRFRGQVVYFARLMAHKDGVLHPKEAEIIDHLHLQATEGLDMEAIRAKAQEVANAKLAAHDIEIDQNRPVKGGHIIPYFQWLDEILLALGIDLMR